MNADDVKMALDALEAQETGDESRVRATAKKVVALAQQKADEVHVVADKAIAAAENGTVRSVNATAALRRLAQDAAAEDTRAALDCVQKIVGARSGFDILSAQVDFARAQTRAYAVRGYSVLQVLARAVHAATREVETSVLQRAR